MVSDAIVFSHIKPEIQEKWERVRDRLRSSYGEAVFKSWLQALKLADIKNGQVMLTIPTRFMREWILTNYADNILRFWCFEEQGVQAVDIFVRPEAPSANAAAASAHQQSVVPLPSGTAGFAQPPVAANEDKPLTPDAISAPLDPRYTFDNFIVGKPNELAHAAARRVAETSTVAPGCNPLFIYGGVGLGKTHLMHAIAWHIRKNDPKRKVLYLSAEKFMYLFVRALTHRRYRVV